MKAKEVQSLLAYATNQEVGWWVQCPPSDYIFWFKSWDVKANIHSLDLFNQTPEKTANDVLAQLKKQNQFPSFIEPKEITISISPDLTKFYESLKPAQEATQNMADKLDEVYSELNDAMKDFSNKVKKLGQPLAGINGNGKKAPADAVMHNKDINQKVSYPCDCVFGTQANLRSIIMHLNDMHKWSREKIADWLDTLPSQPVYYPDLRTDKEKAAEQSYGGAGYVTVTSSTGTVTKYLPISTV